MLTCSKTHIFVVYICKAGAGHRLKEDCVSLEMESLCARQNKGEGTIADGEGAMLTWRSLLFSSRSCLLCSLYCARSVLNFGSSSSTLDSLKSSSLVPWLSASALAVTELYFCCRSRCSCSNNLWLCCTCNSSRQHMHFCAGVRQ